MRIKKNDLSISKSNQANKQKHMLIDQDEHDTRMFISLSNLSY
jgi:hypothetical protein